MNKDYSPHTRTISFWSFDSLRYIKTYMNSADHLQPDMCCTEKRRRCEKEGACERRDHFNDADVWLKKCRYVRVQVYTFAKTVRRKAIPRKNKSVDKRRRKKR
jgi:hypothetical protein